MKSNELPAPRKGRGHENARPDADRGDVFANSDLNASLCDLTGDIMSLGLAAEQFLAAGHEEQWQAALGAAGLDPRLTRGEERDLLVVRQSFAAVAAMLRVTYEVIETIARHEYDLPAASDAPVVVKSR